MSDPLAGCKERAKQDMVNLEVIYNSDRLELYDLGFAEIQKLKVLDQERERKCRGNS